MARKTYIELVDDIDGSSADSTVVFALEGVEYEIDLSAAHVEELHADLTKWIVAARRVGGRARRSSSVPSSAKETAKIRQWARENGYEVSDRGRISLVVRDKYNAAHA
ncbi:MAG: Lsr2 family protein [Dermabacter sp.]|nr:Lsr2 family protein [Dermabacter sp.]